MMALRQPRTPRLASSQTPRTIPKKPSCSVMMLAENNNSQLNRRRSTSLQIKSASRGQVFDNDLEGIVCYVSECGEMICEGYDEGPRFHTTTTTTTTIPTPSIVSTLHSRDAEIIDLLLKDWVQLGDCSCSPYKLNKGPALLQEDY